MSSGPGGVRDLIPCKILLKISVNFPSILPAPKTLCAFNKYRRKPFVRDRHTDTQGQTLSYALTYRDRFTIQLSGRHGFIQQREGRRQRITENSNLDLLLVQWHQEEMLWFISLMGHKYSIGDLKPIINAFKLTTSQCLVWETCEECVKLKNL